MRTTRTHNTQLRNTDRRRHNGSGRHHEPLDSQVVRRGEREESRRRKKTNRRNPDEERSLRRTRGENTNTRIHDELEERRRTRGITTTRQGEFEHEESGECEEEKPRSRGGSPVLRNIRRRLCEAASKITLMMRCAASLTFFTARFGKVSVLRNRRSSVKPK